MTKNKPFSPKIVEFLFTAPFIGTITRWVISPMIFAPCFVISGTLKGTSMYSQFCFLSIIGIFEWWAVLVAVYLLTH